MTISSHNPATGQTVFEVKISDESSVNRALDHARRALASWKKLSIDTRIGYLEAFAARLQQEKETIAKTISQEMGKPLWEAKNEVEGVIKKVPLSIQAYRERCKEGPRLHFQPHGVAAVFGPFNFPLHLPAGHIIPALLAGNTVVFKPSEKTPKTGAELVRLLLESGVPDGVINLVQGGAETGAFLASSPKIDALFFTGSSNVGVKLHETLKLRPEVILALEMGGNNPLVVGAIDDFDAAASVIFPSAYLTSGQRCTCLRRLIALQKDKEALLQPLLKLIHSVKIGPYTDSPEPFMGPLVSADALDKALAKQDELIRLGAKKVLPLQRIKGAFATPGIIDVTGISIPDEEIFAPLIQLICVKTFAEAIKVANATRFGLSASLLSNSDDEWKIFSKEVRAGIINRNRPTVGAPSDLPFGGVGLSGNGRPGAFFAADFCSYPVASLVDDMLKPQEHSYPGLNT